MSKVMIHPASYDDIRRIDEAAPLAFAAGTRYPELAMHTVNR